ncbi:hypothetical protein Efla_003261 [Eimeria flavescens]
MGLPKTALGNDAVLTIVKSLSKMAHFVPTQTIVTAEGVVEVLAGRLIRYHGLPEKFISDRGPRLVADLCGKLSKQFQINRALSSAWHPQTAGQTEWVHTTLEEVLTSLPLTPPMTKLIQRLIHRAAASIIHAQAQQEVYANQHRQPAELTVGDRVWVSTRYMQPRGSAKLQPQFICPFTIVPKVETVAYKLDLLAPMQIHPVCHVCFLQKDKPRPTEMLPPQGREPAEEALKGTRYEVEHILIGGTRNGLEEYLVKWKGYPDEDASWEPKQHLDRCKDLLRAFRANRTRLRRRTRREA